MVFHVQVLRWHVDTPHSEAGEALSGLEQIIQPCIACQHFSCTHNPIGAAAFSRCGREGADVCLCKFNQPTTTLIVCLCGCTCHKEIKDLVQSSAASHSGDTARQTVLNSYSNLSIDLK